MLLWEFLWHISCLNDVNVLLNCVYVRMCVRLCTADLVRIAHQFGGDTPRVAGEAPPPPPPPTQAHSSAGGLRTLIHCNVIRRSFRHVCFRWYRHCYTERHVCLLVSF